MATLSSILTDISTLSKNDINVLKSHRFHKPDSSVAYQFYKLSVMPATLPSEVCGGCWSDHH